MYIEGDKDTIKCTVIDLGIVNVHDGEPSYTDFPQIQCLKFLGGVIVHAWPLSTWSYSAVVAPQCDNGRVWLHTDNPQNYYIKLLVFYI